MKQSLKFLSGLLFGVALVAGMALPALADVYQVDVKASKLEWVGKKVTGQHNGSLLVKDGKVNLEEGKITGGEFEIDMASLSVLDIQDTESNTKLVGHLKSDDFFSVAKHPTAKFMITHVKEKNSNQIEVTGNLTIKGITHAVKIPAKITQQGDMVQAVGAIKLDRTQWNVRYGSGKFFKGLGDKLIDDEFDLKLDLIAKKAG